MPGIFGNLGLFKKGNWQPQPNRCEVGMPEQHILLVEDDPDLLSLLTEVLEDEGYRVSAASRRQQARSALRKGNIDLLIADSVCAAAMAMMSQKRPAAAACRSS
jgi:PleD family two-component response regulator